jgi:hypothetical protein
MSFVSSNDHPNPNNPQDPLYYAPRSVRSQADPRIPQMRPEELPVPTLSRFDEIGEDAFVRSMRPLESQFEYGPRPPRALLATAGGIATAIGIAVIVALAFNHVFPKPNRDPLELAVSVSTAASATPVQEAPEDSQALLQRFKQFQKMQGSENSDLAVSALISGKTAEEVPEKSGPLLEKFIQWQKRE